MIFRRQRPVQRLRTSCGSLADEAYRQRGACRRSNLDGRVGCLLGLPRGPSRRLVRGVSFSTPADVSGGPFGTRHRLAIKDQPVLRSTGDSRRGASARRSEAYLSGIRQVRIRTLPFAFFPAVTKPISVAASSASRTRCRGRPQAWARSVVVVAAPPALCRHLSTSAIARSRSMAVRLRVANMAISGGSTVTTLRADHCETVIHAKGPHTPTRLTPEERRNRRSCQGCRHRARNATPQAGARGDSAVPLC